MARVRKIVDCLSHGKYTSKIVRENLVWSLLLTCEHASNEIPQNNEGWKWGDNDLKQQLPEKHWGIDLGAHDFTLDIIEALEDQNSTILKTRQMDNARAIHGSLSAVSAQFSRLLLDCNRPLGSDTMFRKDCDGVDVDLNRNITEAEKQLRADMFFHPYHAAIDKIMEEESPKIVFSIHSFNPVYEGSKREMEVGILFDDSSEAIGSQVSRWKFYTDIDINCLLIKIIISYIIIFRLLN